MSETHTDLYTYSRLINSGGNAKYETCECGASTQLDSLLGLETDDETSHARPPR